jgi:hypothetical protein
MPSAATAARPPHHRTFPGIRTRGIVTAGIDGIAIPPRPAGSSGRSAFARARPACWRGRWPRGRGTWLFAVAPRAPARVVELDDIGSPPDYAVHAPASADAHTPIRSLPIAVPRLGRWYPAGQDSAETRGTFAFLATQRLRGVRTWLPARKPLVLLVPLVTFITAHPVPRRQGPMSRSRGTIGARRCRGRSGS